MNLSVSKRPGFKAGRAGWLSGDDSLWLTGVAFAYPLSEVMAGLELDTRICTQLDSESVTGPGPDPSCCWQIDTGMPSSMPAVIQGEGEEGDDLFSRNSIEQVKSVQDDMDIRALGSVTYRDVSWPGEQQNYRKNMAPLMPASG